MAARPILISHDGSDGAWCEIDAAASLLGPRRAIVLGLGSQLPLSESLTAAS